MPESARAALAVILPSIDAVMEYTATRARYAMAAEGCRTTVVAEESVQVALLRDVIGPLVFRPVIPDSAWVTPTVISLSQAVYADRAFDRVPILADALEDAGCTNQDILSHCRGAGPHALGCWVVDLLLGKE